MGTNVVRANRPAVSNHRARFSGAVARYEQRRPTHKEYDFSPRLQPMKIYRRLNLPERLQGKKWDCITVPPRRYPGRLRTSLRQHYAAQLDSFFSAATLGSLGAADGGALSDRLGPQADPHQVAPALPRRRRGAVTHGGRHPAAVMSIIAVADGGTAAKRLTIPRSPRLPISRRRRVPSRRCLVRS